MRALSYVCDNRIHSFPEYGPAGNLFQRLVTFIRSATVQSTSDRDVRSLWGPRKSVVLHAQVFSLMARPWIRKWAASTIHRALYVETECRKGTDRVPRISSFYFIPIKSDIIAKPVEIPMFTANHRTRRAYHADCDSRKYTYCANRTHVTHITYHTH